MRKARPPLTPCEELGHDYGNGPGGLAPLSHEGGVQTCSVCGICRGLIRGRLRYARPREEALLAMQHRKLH